MSLVLALLLGGLALFGVVLIGRYVDARAWRASLMAFTVRLPFGLTVDDVARWLSGVAAATHAPRLSLLPFPPIALEVIATKDGIEHVLLVPEKMQGAIMGGLRAALPGVRVTETPEYLMRRYRFTTAAEAVLTSHRRIMSTDRAEGTVTGVLAALQPLYGSEVVVLQWILTGAGTPARFHRRWPSSEQWCRGGCRTKTYLMARRSGQPGSSRPTHCCRPQFESV